MTVAAYESTVQHPTNQQTLYDRDFHAWTHEMAEALRSSQWEGLDVGNLVEEIESLGRRERQELENRLAVLLGHLLKWQYQSTERSNSWRATIREQRRRISKLLIESPSLKSYRSTALLDAYLNGLDLEFKRPIYPMKPFRRSARTSLNGRSILISFPIRDLRNLGGQYGIQ